MSEQIDTLQFLKDMFTELNFMFDAGLKITDCKEEMCEQFNYMPISTDDLKWIYDDCDYEWSGQYFKIFEWKGQTYKFTFTYKSHWGSEYWNSEIYPVKPKTITVTVWE